jgi:hypothetical protein
MFADDTNLTYASNNIYDINHICKDISGDFQPQAQAKLHPSCI